MKQLVCSMCESKESVGFEVTFEGEDIREIECICDVCKMPGADEFGVARQFFSVRDP